MASAGWLWALAMSQVAVFGPTDSSALVSMPQHACLLAWRGLVAFRAPPSPHAHPVLSAEGWKLVTLLRLSPIAPWNVLNYALSVTAVPLMAYFLASAVAVRCSCRRSRQVLGVLGERRTSCANLGGSGCSSRQCACCAPMLALPPPPHQCTIMHNVQLCVHTAVS